MSLPACPLCRTKTLELARRGGLRVGYLCETCDEFYPFEVVHDDTHTTSEDIVEARRRDRRREHGGTFK